MPEYKLTYFNIRARGETARVLFKLADVVFKDERIGDKEWPEFKTTKAPFGSLPILEVDERQLTESRAIYRYLAREFGFYGENNWQNAEIDCVMDMLEDVISDSNLEIVFTGSEEEKPKAVAKYTEKVKKVLGHLEKKLKQNEEGDGYFVGSKMTVGDIHYYNTFDFVGSFTSKEVFSDFPKLSGLRQRVGENDVISAWVEKRPVTFC